MQALWLVAGIAVLVGFVVLQYVMKQRRRDALAEFALTYRMEYSPVDPFGLVDSSFRLFQQGDGRGCENAVWGAWQGLQVKEADYWYYTESTDSNGNRTKSYHYFSVALVDIDAALPYVRVEKENFLSVVTSHLGFHDIDFESEQFNRMYKVKSEDREFAFKLVDDRMMQWLLSMGGQFGFEVRGSRYLVYCHKLSPAALIPIFGAAKAFMDHVPRLVWSEYGSGVEAGGQPAAPAAPGMPAQPAAPPAPAQPAQPPAPAAAPAPMAPPKPAPAAPPAGGPPTFVNDDVGPWPPGTGAPGSSVS